MKYSIIAVEIQQTADLESNFSPVEKPLLGPGSIEVPQGSFTELHLFQDFVCVCSIIKVLLIITFAVTIAINVIIITIMGSNVLMIITMRRITTQPTLEVIK